MDLLDLRERLTGVPVTNAIAASARSDDALDLIEGPICHAAVLVPLVHGSSAQGSSTQGYGPGVLLTLRTSHLRAHAGQVAFPGGRMDAIDASPEAAALREAQEEIGLDPADVELAGRLPEYVTGSGYHITPVIGLLPAGLRLTPSPDEVEAIFTLPLATLLDPNAPEQRTREFRGRQRRFWVWPHETHYIWGATAGILLNLAARLRAQA